MTQSGCFRRTVSRRRAGRIAGASHACALNVLRESPAPSDEIVKGLRGNGETRPVLQAVLRQVPGVLPVEPDNRRLQVFDLSSHHSTKNNTERCRTRQPGAQESKERRDHPTTSTNAMQDRGPPTRRMRDEEFLRFCPHRSFEPVSGHRHRVGSTRYLLTRGRRVTQQVASRAALAPAKTLDDELAAVRREKLLPFGECFASVVGDDPAPERLCRRV
jgi:hypothetical protein